MSGYKEDDIKLGMYFYQGALPGSHSSRKWSYELTHRNIECSKFANEKILPEGNIMLIFNIHVNLQYSC
jgi:hypothetical protein